MSRLKLFLVLMLCGLTQQALAREGYRIQVKFTNTTDSMVFLTHYYGKPLPTIYKSDSARIDKNGVAVLERKDPVIGGIYMLLLSDKQTYFEFLLNDGDNMNITVDVSKLPEGISFKNSPENVRFQEYVKFLKGFAEEQQKLQKEYAAAETAADSSRVREQIVKGSKSLTQFRKDYVAKHPNTLLSGIFSALEMPQVPEGKHYLPGGNEDSTFAYRYYKSHYWDGFNFKDDRLIHTPIYDTKLDEYFNKLVAPHEDSVIKEADLLLGKTRGQKELFKYTLWWITRNAESSNIMGMDRVFVYLVENYYMKGDAYWLDNEALGKYYDRASKIAPNLIGRVAAEIKMKGLDDQYVSLSDVKADYTIVVFWDPSCGHCTKEVPQIDSVYRAVLKDKGVRIFAVRTEGDVKQWKEFIEKHQLNDWVHVYDPEHQSNYRTMYDVYSTPVVYILDDKKIIRGKRLDHSNLASVIEMLEKKQANNNKPKS